MDDEVEALKRRVAALEAEKAQKAQPEPAARWHAPYDWTERMSPPVRRTGMERYRQDQTPEEALMEARKNANPLGTLRPLAEWLAERQPAAPVAEPPKAQAVTVPIGPPPGIEAVDAIAKGFADRERLEELAKQIDIARKLKGL
jgi:hypothetical protein